MGAATILPVVDGGVDEQAAAAAAARRTRRELVARRADAARARDRRAKAPALFAGEGKLRLVPRFELVGEALVANDDLAPLRRSRSAAPDRTARPVGPAAAVVLGASTHPRRGPMRPERSAVGAATYRRRRLVAGALVLGVLLAGSWALGVLGGGPLTASGVRSPASVSVANAVPVSRTTYVVQPGDTLWSIARAVQARDKSADVRPIVDALAAERHGRPLEVGETIVLP